jgi:hypothetical protein
LPFKAPGQGQREPDASNVSSTNEEIAVRFASMIQEALEKVISTEPLGNACDASLLWGCCPQPQSEAMDSSLAM